MSLKNIPGFKQLKAYKHNRCWYIVDCVDGSSVDRVFSGCTIGGYFETYGLLCSFAIEWYTGQYN